MHLLGHEIIAANVGTSSSSVARRREEDPENSTRTATIVESWDIWPRIVGTMKKINTRGLPTSSQGGTTKQMNRQMWPWELNRGWNIC